MKAIRSVVEAAVSAAGKASYVRRDRRLLCDLCVRRESEEKKKQQSARADAVNGEHAISYGRAGSWGLTLQ